jgi:hypothetical protein
MLSPHQRLVYEMVVGEVPIWQLKEQGADRALVAAVVTVSIVRYLEPPDRQGRVALPRGFAPTLRERYHPFLSSEGNVRWLKKILRDFGMLIGEGRQVHLQLPKELHAVSRQLARESAALLAEAAEHEAERLSSLAAFLKVEHRAKATALGAIEFMLEAHRDVQDQELARLAELLRALHRGVGHPLSPSLGVFVEVLDDLLGNPAGE